MSLSLRTPPPLDIIGDIHGELPALEALSRELGYHVEDGWTHPEGRTLVFLGDLVDRGAHSLEVADRRFVDRGSVQLSNWIGERQPAACVCGHVHHREAVTERLGETTVVNAGLHGWVLRV